MCKKSPPATRVEAAPQTVWNATICGKSIGSTANHRAALGCVFGITKAGRIASTGLNQNL